MKPNKNFDRQILKFYSEGMSVYDIVRIFNPVYREKDIHNLIDEHEWATREIKKHMYETKQSVHLMEAFEVFEEHIYDMCMVNIGDVKASKKRREHFSQMLKKFRSWKNKDEQLMVEKAKEYPIIELVSQFTDDPNGVTFYRNIKCILHDDSTASMKLYENNTYYCFGCNQGGDTIDLLMKKRGVDFISAVKWLTNS